MPVPTLISDLSVTPSLNSPQGTESAKGTIDDYLRAHAAFIRQTSDLVLGATVTLSSASTVAIGFAASSNIAITGTTTINAFDTYAEGALRYVTFLGAMTLVNGAALALPTAANITTVSGDSGLFKSLGGGNWKCLMYQRLSGLTLTQASASANGYLTAADWSTFNAATAALALKAPLASPAFTGVVSSAGNLLIGTTTDNGVDKLQVNGNVTVSGVHTATTPNTGIQEILRVLNTSATAGVNSGVAIKLGYGGAGYGTRIVSGGDPTAQFPGYLAFERGAGSSSYTESMRIDQIGNVGIGTSAYTQGSTLQLGRVFSFAADVNSGYMGAGWFGTTSGAATYAVTGNYAVRAHMDSAVGNMLWLNAASGTAGAAVTWSERMRLTQAGNLLINTATDDGTNKLQVNGSAKFTDNISAVSASVTIQAVFDGKSSGTNGGSSVITRVAGITSMAIGNKSAIAGGAYDATPYLYANSTIFTNVGMNITGNLAVSGTVTAATVTQTSDERKKKNWQRLPADFIEKFASIKKAGLFQWRKGGAHCVGVGAQSLEVIMPAAVHTDEKGDKSVNTGGAALAIAHELSREVVRLRARLEHLESAK